MSASDDSTTGRVQCCPMCGAQFTGWCHETTQDDPIEYDGSVLSDVLAGRTVIEIPTAVVVALILNPCGCRVPSDEWQLCMVPGAWWFARPDDVEGTIRRALAGLA